jgi:uncharacterized protein (UPF0332 family)
MSLEDWLKNDWLRVHSTSAEEIQALLRSADEDLRSARIEGVAAGWKLNMAYTAALRCARATLYACGYRPGREREHERTIDSLSLTVISVNADTIRLLHKIRKMRHAVTYDSVDVISETEAEEAMSAAADLHQQVAGWFALNHPHLLASSND